MNTTTGQNPNQVYNLTVSLNGGQFCSVALVNNLDKEVIFRLGPNNNSTVSERQLDSDFLVDFSNNLVYEMQNYVLFEPLGQISNANKTINGRKTMILIGANNQVNATAPQTFQLQYMYAGNFGLHNLFGMQSVYIILGLVATASSLLA